MLLRLCLGSRVVITAQTDPPPPPAFTVMSGGQTGVDRAALDAAILLGIDHDGFCPAGRLAEDGAVPERYNLAELPTRSYPARTRANVAHGCATVVITPTPTLSPGSRLTLETADRLGKPHVHHRLSEDTPAQLAAWLTQLRPAVLNVGGTRKSKAPGIHGRALALLTEALPIFLGQRVKKVPRDSRRYPTERRWYDLPGSGAQNRLEPVDVRRLGVPGYLRD